MLADLLLTIGFAVFSTFRIEGSWDPGDYGLTESSSSSTIATSSNASDDDDDDDDEDMLDPSGVGEKTEASEDLMENRVVSSIDEIADGTVSDHSDDGNTDEADDSTTHANTRAPPSSEPVPDTPFNYRRIRGGLASLHRGAEILQSLTTYSSTANDGDESRFIPHEDAVRSANDICRVLTTYRGHVVGA